MKNFLKKLSVWVIITTGVLLSGCSGVGSADSTQSHLKSTLLGGFTGNYQLSITGGDANSGTVQVDCTGNITAQLSSGVTATGLVTDSSGSVSGTTSDGSTWQGHIDLATGVGNGTWKGLHNQGTWNVTRTQSTSSSCNSA